MSLIQMAMNEIRAGKLVQRNIELTTAAHAVGKKIVEHLGDAVLSGPFGGMRIGSIGRIAPDDPASEFAWTAELIGCYEQELHLIVEGLLSQSPRTIVNIGSSVGYYAVGLALRNPAARVIAFDSEPARQEACARLADENHLRDRITIRGQCSRSELHAIGEAPDAAGSNDTAGSVLIVCDCDGGELDLLQPAAVPLLRRSAILVETHDFILPNLTQRLMNRFASTHTIACINTTPPHADSYARRLPFLSPQELALAVADGRPSQLWLAMTPIASESA